MMLRRTADPISQGRCLMGLLNCLLLQSVVRTRILERLLALPWKLDLYTKLATG